MVIQVSPVLGLKLCSLVSGSAPHTWSALVGFQILMLSLNLCWVIVLVLLCLLSVVADGV